VYAKGFSYLSTDPRACVNCHVMNAQYDAWRMSGHRHTATCVECHLPHEGLAKWVAKADHGFRSLRRVHLAELQGADRDHAPGSRDVRVNCVRCHEGLVHAVADAPGRKDGALDCMHCTPAPVTARAAETRER